MEIRKLLMLITPPIVLQQIHKFRKNAKPIRGRKTFESKGKLHLACGDNVLDDWTNIDISSNGEVIGWDLTEPLPVLSGTIEYIFCEHFIEHITLEQATALLVECHRVFRPGGILRLSTPDLKKLIDEYLAGRTAEWCDVGWKPVTPCQMVNEAHRLWGHKFLYDASELKRILEEAGFHKVTQVAWRESTIPVFKEMECRPFHSEIIFEATK